jgi:hypothetical protein
MMPASTSVIYIYIYIHVVYDLEKINREQQTLMKQSLWSKRKYLRK